MRSESAREQRIALYKMLWIIIIISSGCVWRENGLNLLRMFQNNRNLLRVRRIMKMHSKVLEVLHLTSYNPSPPTANLSRSNFIPIIVCSCLSLQKRCFHRKCTHVFNILPCFQKRCFHRKCTHVFNFRYKIYALSTSCMYWWIYKWWLFCLD